MFPTEDRDGWYYIAEGICWVSTLIHRYMEFPHENWLRGVDLNHRPLGYEGNVGR